MDSYKSLDLWDQIVANYDLIEGAQISNSFITLLVLSEAEEGLTSTQISGRISKYTRGRIFRVPGALKDSLDNRLLRGGYVSGTDMLPPQENENRKGKKRISKRLYLITPKGRKLIECWMSFLSPIRR